MATAALVEMKGLALAAVRRHAYLAVHRRRLSRST